VLITSLTCHITINQLRRNSTGQLFDLLVTPAGFEYCVTDQYSDMIMSEIKIDARLKSSSSVEYYLVSLFVM